MGPFTRASTGSSIGSTRPPLGKRSRICRTGNSFAQTLGIGTDLEADLSRVLQTMPGLGLPRAHGIDMSHAASPIFVVKVVVPEALSTIPC